MADPGGRKGASGGASAADGSGGAGLTEAQLQRRVAALQVCVCVFLGVCALGVRRVDG